LKPAPFDYVAAHSLEAALSTLQEYGDDAKLLAGGQSLIPLLNFRLAKPTILVDLNRVPNLDYVRPAVEGGLRLGAMVRQSRLETDPLIAEKVPLLAEAVPFIAHPQIRNRGTIGGTLAHADPAAELPAVAVALEARLRLQSRAGERWVDAESFFVGLLTTALEPEEILVEIEIPPAPHRTGWSFLEISRRHGDYALAGLAARVTLDDAGRCTAARLVFMSVGDGPVVADSAAAILVGSIPEDGLIDDCSHHAAEAEIQPTGDIHASAAFKRHLCRVLTGRALRTAIARART
jgi:CO/xanthine dehydrogenase FAD-binding subunit